MEDNGGGVSREGELLASEQMRDTIADMLERQAAIRDRRPPERRNEGPPPDRGSRLLWGMAQEVRRMPGRAALPNGAKE
ncbi:hypothetical protein [Flavisphingomonas formosensis]|uniref:hypothetical protein n=1 Tax=Flavisphingomonas formosensis TaxID=861534 RepID=UPI0012F709FB|nr:hypothetical protein [Sphingomonas formosensis]